MANLDRDYEYYLRNKDHLVATYRGRFIAIREEKVLNAYDTHDAALAETLKVYAAGTFLIQKCDDEDQVMRFHSRVTFASA